MKVIFTKHDFELHLIDLAANSGVSLVMFDSIGFNVLMGETACQAGVSILRKGVRNLIFQRFE